MPAIGFGMLWTGYTLLFWGYCQIRGYDISIKEIVVPKAWDGKWPPPLINDAPKSKDPGVKPGDHPGDMPWTYTDPNKSDASSGGGGSSSDSGGGVFNA